MNDIKKDLIDAIIKNADSQKDQNPFGKIISPLKQSTTGTVVNVSGETKEIRPDQHLWLAVEKAHHSLCWPKGPITQKNSQFTSVIYEEGVQGPYTLSLFATDETLNNHWLGWIYSRKYKGLPLPPSNMRLDSVDLIKGEDIPDHIKEAHKLFSEFQDKPVARKINESLIRIEKNQPDKLYYILEHLEEIIKEGKFK